MTLLRGLVLTGGGARAAYQAGSLAAIYEIASSIGIENPFQILTGTSAGAINVCYLAAHADLRSEAVQHLVSVWRNLHSNMIFKSDTLSLLRIVSGTLLSLASGRKIGTSRNNPSLLDNRPLRELIEREIPVHKIQENINKQLVHSVAIDGVNYANSKIYTFFQSMTNIANWVRANHQSERTVILTDHIMASLGIPIIFPSVRIGNDYYGDGSLRNYKPFSPAIKLGADKLMVIAVRGPRQNKESQTMPSLGRVAGLALNSVLLDATDIDFERLTRINDSVHFFKPDAQTRLKNIDIFMIRPSVDIGQLAATCEPELPWFVRYLLRGLGDPKESADLISYLLFESNFTSKLVDLGYKDAMAQEAAIRNFLET